MKSSDKNSFRFVVIAQVLIILAWIPASCRNSEWLPENCAKETRRYHATYGCLSEFKVKDNGDGTCALSIPRYMQRRGEELRRQILINCPKYKDREITK